jgi:hypothetical protein
MRCFRAADAPTRDFSGPVRRTLDLPHVPLDENDDEAPPIDPAPTPRPGVREGYRKLVETVAKIEIAPLPAPRTTAPTERLVQMSASSSGARWIADDGQRHTVTVHVSEDLAWLYRDLERVHRRAGLAGTFVEFLCLNVWVTWSPYFGRMGRKWREVHVRERYRCSSPVCTSKCVTYHHIEYLSHGGSDDPDNGLLPCDFCHLDGEHAGRLKIIGTASCPLWIIGNPPVLVVEGRTKRELDPLREEADNVWATLGFGPLAAAARAAR